jgi:hypothetical protein
MIARVAESEHDVLLVARALVGQVPRAAIEPILLSARPLPAKLGPTAARLMKETLSVGCVRELMRRGGWQRAAIVDGERVVHGRAWERTPPLALSFSPLAMHLCRWLAGAPLHEPAKVPELPSLAPALGDELLLYLAFELLPSALVPQLARQATARASVLCRLAFPDRVQGDDAPRVEPWLSGGGAIVVAALAPELTRRWVAVAEGRGARGSAHDAIAGAFLDACDALGRRDLASFVVDAGIALLRGRDARAVAARIAPSLGRDVSLAARAAARHAAGAPLRAFLRAGRWHEEHRLVRHFDDGYAAAQHLLRRWEEAAPLFPIAEAVLRELDALDAPLGDRS